ncbi:DUF4271 domain-containing protein [Daejeonella lutea]|uniref:DUF4271 domain-containing protein n=1 Tax=Daejeonella lutea TaxID=572036 RepID=A0A1T5CZU7_9SPHI|nr:DUF4271 domain-containing protein [Daejeonella lutea]SKB64876.1 protein of unknown function [Daejeonella lutea]
MGKLKRLHGVLLVLFLLNSTAWAQNDTTSTFIRTPRVYRPVYRDSAFLARRQFIRDSIKNVQDSLAIVWIKKPDVNRPNRFIDSLIKLYKVENLDFSGWAAKFPRKVNRYDEGTPRPTGERWIMGVVLFLVLFFAVIKFFFSKELGSIVQSFYSNQILGQINKEDNLFSSWPFIFLYLLFGLIVGLYLYLASKYLQLSYPVEGFELFILLSALVIGLFTVKIIVLRLLGFLFDISRLVREYVSILYLSYFNSALIFLPLVIAFSLTPSRYAGIFGYAGIVMLVLIFILQFLRAGTNILSNYRFPKVYLIIYLCALEFCPLIILFKALRF